VTDAVTIAFFNPFFKTWPAAPTACATPAVFTHEPDALATADAVVFHLPTLDRPSFNALAKPRDQLWVGWSMETMVMRPAMKRRRTRRRMDLTMTHERTSDVWHPYFEPDIVHELLRPPSPKTRSAPVVWMQSNVNDRSGRKPYASDLARCVWIDSFGAVARNREERIPRGREHQIALYRQYKFTLAFENSIAPDYVTEKFWFPLVAGSVPVYRGTEDIAALAPAPGCYIDTRDFSSAMELGAYLDHLDRHDDEYARFHEWRSQDVSASFKALLPRLQEPPLCRLAALVAARRLRPPHASAGRRRRSGRRRT
jgi:hypothetical protein